MENQRFVLFIALSFAAFFGWITFGPKFFPGMFPKPAVEKQDDEEKTKTGKTELAEKKSDSKTPSGKTLAKKSVVKTNTKTGAPKTKVKEEIKPLPVVKIPTHLPQVVTLGSPDPKSGYFVQVELTSLGASIVNIQLNDERYVTIADRDAPLKVVGNSNEDGYTLNTSVPLIDKQLEKQGGLGKVHWGVLPKSLIIEGGITRGVTFYYDAPDKSLRVTKRFWMEKVDLKEGLSSRELRTQQDTQSTGYELIMELQFEDLSHQQQIVNYTLQGPIGVPLENRENARVFRGIVVGVFEEGGEVASSEITANKLNEAETEEWERSLRYIGVDTQYFAAILVPGGDQQKSPYLETAIASALDNPSEENHTDITFELRSKEITVPADGKVSHEYTLYTGPKRKDLLETYQATDAIKYGWFGIVAQAMLWMLALFHDSMAIPYGIAIICLTAVVRGGMFPLSKKQAKGAQKMKELQPKIAELKKKYGKDREKMARAQMELFNKHGYNPLAGCLPIFLQLPIFIGLYQGLSNAVDLRLAPFPFTWITNLAAPDALFRLPFKIIFIGQNFNILPLVTMVLFVVQQKLFMPPPADEQQAMQQKMMSWMSIVFGFIFYHVPSGLCVYFIASSLWGIGERKLLDARKKKEEAEKGESSEDENGKPADKSCSDDEKLEKPTGFFGKLLGMADQAADARANANENADSPKNSPAKSKNQNQNRGNNKNRKSGKKNKRRK